MAKAWGFQPTPANTDIFLCGTPHMIEQVMALLNEEGFGEHSLKEAGEIYVERF